MAYMPALHMTRRDNADGAPIAAKGKQSSAYSFGPCVLVLLQFALVHLHLSQALPSPPR